MNPESIALQGMAPLFQVFDMPTAIKFYTEVIGFEVVSTSTPQGEHFDWALLRRNEIEVMLNTGYEQDQRPSSPDLTRIAAHEDTSLYFGCPDVDAWYAFLLTKGIAVEKPIITGYGWKALYVKDPDGYLLCFHWPLKESLAQ
ncbi:VOC family protein [Chryseolinea soli]|uniref:VOC family protein n=1 Tax=Chryseolinea soli TaxID=2321403 RepID=A0A385SQL3_9BACT|nr:VOC family protein [Chryseolinea soli]AYB33142.1 VOC family protein [Chryseolinea soli]